MSWSCIYMRSFTTTVRPWLQYAQCHSHYRLMPFVGNQLTKNYCTTNMLKYKPSQGIVRWYLHSLSASVRPSIRGLFRVNARLFLCRSSLCLVPFCIKSVKCAPKFRPPREASSRKTVHQLSWYDLWVLIKPQWFWLCCAVAAAILTALVNIKMPLVLGELIDAIAELVREQVKDNTSITPILSVAVQLVGYYAAQDTPMLQAVLTAAYISTLTVLGERMATTLRLNLFKSLVSQDIAFFDANRVTELVARLNADVHEFKSSFKLCIGQGLRTITQIGGSVVSLYFISTPMTIVTVCALPLVVVVGTCFGALLRALSRKAQEQAARTAVVAEEALGNIRTVRAFAMENQETELVWLFLNGVYIAVTYIANEHGLFKTEVVKLEQLNELLGFGIGVFQGLTKLALNGMVVGVLYGGSRLISQEQLAPGDLMAFLVTAQTIQRSMEQLSVLFGQAIRGYTAGARVFEFVHAVPVLPLSGGLHLPYHSLLGELEFSDVVFHYPTRPEYTVFDSFNLKLEAGKTTALVGPSGAGKSTVASLLCRFYDTDSGEVTVDGIPLHRLDPQWWRGRALAFISQEPVLFATSIKENIRYGKPEATDEEIISAARQANAEEFIAGLPDGYDTLVGERGVMLSGGQKQRVAIARALIKDPPILILDEATSALDSQSERLVHDALERACRNRTVLIIAHRLSTVQNADCIAVLGDGKVLETGTHGQLMKKKGAYYKLVSAQSNSEIEKLLA